MEAAGAVGLDIHARVAIELGLSGDRGRGAPGPVFLVITASVGIIGAHEDDQAVAIGVFTDARVTVIAGLGARDLNGFDDRRD
jgi:hypothetical protein